ncbi:Acetolactate synthase large subunit [Paramicrobacterium humi]|uniref:Acetolactate synthase large subunit n=1 Tax=Paramicrobacterium humi TaxID=640635 RepID=A0A1H4NPR2_9MICO|nr:thiamine pyrophosphate-binding protein [Microbacterium humi]SEB96572.1 Acetolactate synthase large subunit [Microbacterium humi]
MPTVARRIAETLSAHLTDVFGVMGNGNAYLLDALDDTPARYTALRHEAGAVAAADAYFRTSGRIAAATATYGAGFSNTVTPLAEAVQAHTPLVLVVGDAPTTGARPWDVDQTAIAAAVGARTFTVSRSDAATTTRAALEHALNHRTAVVLAIPYDLAGAEASDADDDAERPLRLAPALHPAPEPLERAAEALRGARRPLILVGRGAWLAGAGPALDALADRLGALTTSSALGRGLLSPGSDIGVAGGFGQDEAMRLAAEADVVVAAGAGLNQFTTRFGFLFGESATVIQLDVADTATNPRVDCFVTGDARLTAEALLDRLGDAPSTGWRDSVGDLAGLHRREPGDVAAPDGLLDPRSLTARLERALPAERTVVTDGGHFLGWVNTYLTVSAPDRFAMVGTAYQTIGLGLPSMVGAAAARPDELTVLCTGDGGGLMALADLESTIRRVRRGLIVVYNDAAYGAEVHLYGLAGFAEDPMLIPAADFAGMARSLGARASTVASLDDLAEVETWLADGAEGVFLLDCRVSRSIRAPYQDEIIAQNGTLFEAASVSA